MNDKPARDHQGNDDDNKPWLQDRTSMLAVIAIVLSLASASTSAYLAYQANGVAKQQGVVAKQQAVVAEQEELVSLVSSIAQEPATLAQESGNLQDNSAAQHNAEVGTQLTELADGEEADYLISLLPSSSVTAEEYYFTAMGLQAGESDTQALHLLGEATAMRADPRTRANIFRAEAQILYQGDEEPAAENDIGQAIKAFQIRGVTSEEYLYNEAYTDFFDAQFQAQIDCSAAQQEYTSAKSALTTIMKTPGANAVALQNQEVTDETIPNINKPIPVTAGGIVSKPCADYR